MPLLVRRAVQFGGAAVLLNIAANAFGRHEKVRTEHKIQLQQQPQQQASAGSLYVHQPYCNGTCGERCNGVGNYQHAPYCTGGCSGRCVGMSGGQELGQGRSVFPRPPRQRLKGQGQAAYGQQQQPVNLQGHTLDPLQPQGATRPVENGSTDAEPPSYKF